jgi:hypothetical protein
LTERIDDSMSQPQMETPGGLGSRNSEQIARQFASRVGRFEPVARVVALPLAEGLSVWTLLDGDFTGRARQVVYDAQYGTLRQYPGTPLDFRVIDAAEYPPEQRPTLLPADAVPLFERAEAMCAGTGRQSRAG